MNEKAKNIETEYVELMWIDITRLSKSVQFLLCCLFIFGFYLLYGYLQEYLFTTGGFKQYGWYITLIQFMYYSIFGYVEILCRRTKRLIPLKTYYLLAALTVGTLGFSNGSLKYLNYPTQVIFKCCKLIPVMIGGILIQKKEYKFIDYVASITLCLGLIAFCLADNRVSPNFHFIGVIVISLALACDAAIGNVQEKAMKVFKGPNYEIAFYSHFIGFFYVLVALSISGDLYAGAEYGYQRPILYVEVLMFALSGYLGLQVVLTLVRTCGALTAVTVTTFRKALSIVMSFMFFEKPFTWHYFWGGILIVVGIYLNILGKNQVDLVRTARKIRIMRRKRRKSPLDIV